MRKYNSSFPLSHNVSKPAFVILEKSSYCFFFPAFQVQHKDTVSFHGRCPRSRLNSNRLVLRRKKQDNLSSPYLVFRLSFCSIFRSPGPRSTWAYATDCLSINVDCQPIFLIKLQFVSARRQILFIYTSQPLLQTTTTTKSFFIYVQFFRFNFNNNNKNIQLTTRKT